MILMLSREELHGWSQYLRQLDYESRLKLLNLPTLTYHQLRGNVINVYKYLHGIFTLLRNMFNHDLYEDSQGHSLKLFKDQSKREVTGIL